MITIKIVVLSQNELMTEISKSSIWTVSKHSKQSTSLEALSLLVLPVMCMKRGVLAIGYKRNNEAHNANKMSDSDKVSVIWKLLEEFGTDTKDQDIILSKIYDMLNTNTVSRQYFLIDYITFQHVLGNTYFLAMLDSYFNNAITWW